MRRTNSKKYRLKRKIRILLKSLIAFMFIYFLLNHTFISKVFFSAGDTYIKSNFLKTNNTKMALKSYKEEDYDTVFKADEKSDQGDYLVYLYNTHQTETYIKKEGLLYNPTIVTASSYLKEKLSLNGVPTYLEERSITDILVKNNWKYSSSYKASRALLEDIVITKPTLKYFFDIHRDSSSYNNSTLCVDNVCYAKILFVIGLENPGYKENYDFALKLNDKLNNHIRGISKGIIGKEGKGVNGIYNQDFNKNVLLIEVGGDKNDINEVYRTMGILSDVISEYIKEDNNGY